MKKITYIALLFAFTITVKVEAQDKKIWASGAARTIFQQNEIAIPNDTVTPRKASSGYALVDLALNAQPNKNTYINAMIRVRNDLGGFWGGGVTFDLRQMYVKGLIKDAIRYQLGDINYKLTPFTFYNNQEELTHHQMDALNIFRDIVRYDMFYQEDNSWRQQGAAVDFALAFNKGIEEMVFNIFASRNRPTDFGNQNERVFFGGNALLKQSKYFTAGINYIDLMDLQGTSRSNMAFHNPVITATTAWNYDLSKISLDLNSESGISEMYEINNPNMMRLRDYFYDLTLSGKIKKTGTKANLGYSNVGPQFRSIGAQTKRVNFQAINQFYGRYGNEQVARDITNMDLLQDVSLYQLSFDPSLNDYSIVYDNITPFGKATPNRKGLTFDIEHQSKDSLVAFSGAFAALSEVVGQGSKDLRSFNQLRLYGALEVDRLLKNYKKSIQISAGYTRGNTTRNTPFPQANIDFSNSFLDLGIKVALVSNFDIVATQRFISANGNEFKSVRGNSTEVVNFAEEKYDLNEQMLILALRYHFSKKNTLNVVWQKMRWTDSQSMKPAYDLNQFAIVYTLNF